MIKNYFTNKITKGFRFAYHGLVQTFKDHVNFRIHLLAATLVCGLGCYLHLSPGDWLWVITAIGIVLILELVNTSIELIVDLVSPTYSLCAKRIKDAAAAAVLIASLVAAFIGLIIFVPKLL